MTISRRPWRMLIGRGESIAIGSPRKLHQRIACASFSACLASMAGVTDEVRFAVGMRRLSNDNSQNPLMSGEPCAASVPTDQSNAISVDACLMVCRYLFCAGGTIESRWLGSLESHHDSNAQLAGGVRSATIWYVCGFA